MQSSLYRRFQSYMDKQDYYVKPFFTFQPCKHSCNGHGTCQRTGQYSSNFYCTCKRGYEGEKCETTRKACDLAKSEGNVCQHGGKCRNDRDPFDYSCICLQGWNGKHCEIPDVSPVPLLFRNMTDETSTQIMNVLLTPSNDSKLCFS